MLQQGIVKCEEFKDYTSHICCEEHPVVVAGRFVFIICVVPRSKFQSLLKLKLNRISTSVRQGCTMINDILTFIGCRNGEEA